MKLTKKLCLAFLATAIGKRLPGSCKCRSCKEGGLAVMAMGVAWDLGCVTDVNVVETDVSTDIPGGCQRVAWCYGDGV